MIERALRARMGRAPQWRTAEHHAGYFLPYFGFDRPTMTVVADGLATARTARETGEHWAATFEQPGTRAAVVALGLASEAEIAAVAAAWRAWGHEPGAILVVHWFCAVAWKARA